MTEKSRGLLSLVTHYDRTIVFWFGVLLAVFGWYFGIKDTQKVSAADHATIGEHEKRLVQLEKYQAVQNEVNTNLRELVQEMKRSRGR